MATRRPPLSVLSKCAAGLSLFIGVGAVAGSAMMWLAPEASRMNELLPDLQKLPLADVFFTSLVWPGVFLLLVNGLPQVWAAVLVLQRRRGASHLVVACGLMLLGWIAIQFVVFPLNWLSSLYGLFAVVELGLGLSLLRTGRS